MSEDEIYEITFLGRGGQGAVTAAQILAQAAISKGLYALANPEFGPERRGAPVRAYLRVSRNPIETREPIVEPNILLVMHPDLLSYFRDLINRTRDYLVVNAKDGSFVDKVRELFDGTIVYLDAYAIAMKYLGRPIVNTAMIGGLLRVLDIVTLEDVEAVISENFSSEKIAKLNIEALREAYRAARVVSNGG
jgi:pyruvate ferredoxin oxidoreductase gamma subunit